MFLRDTPSKTLADVREELDSTTIKVMSVATDQINFDLEANQTITFGEGKGQVTVPADVEGIKAFGDWFDVPSKFLLRVEPDLQQTILNSMLRRHPATGNVNYTDEGVKLIRDPNAKWIDPRKMVGVAAKVIDNDAPVVDHWSNNDEFRLDVIAPEGFDRGIGGDKKVGDITRGGIRITQDVKHNLAPAVSEFMYRLVCTNGMERYDQLLKVDARGNTVDEVLAEMEIMADRAFRRVEKTIASFYDMRNQRVENPERTILRMANEAGIPSRTALQLAERIPANVEDGTASMFDLVNLITNQANDPHIRSRAGARRNLEQAGGTLVTEHADRCGHCQSKLA